MYIYTPCLPCKAAPRNKIILQGLTNWNWIDMTADLYSARIESIGIEVPEKRLSTKDLMNRMKHKVNIDLERLTGITERRVCSEGEDSYSMALSAARDCLKYSHLEGTDIEMVINCSISRSKEEKTLVFEPPFSLSIKEEIGAPNALNFDISNACAGMLTGVFILNRYIQSGVVKNGIVVSGEYITPISDNAVETVKTIASKQLASLTVGDAGAAVILERAENGEGLSVSQFATLSKYSDLCIGQTCRRSPGGFMKANARKIHRVAIADSPELLRHALEVSGIEMDDIDHIIPHQTSERSIMSGVKKLSEYFGKAPKNVVINLKDYGNTASTTVFLALYKYLKKGVIKKGERIMLICYASGLVVGVIILRMDGLVEIYGK